MLEMGGWLWFDSGAERNIDKNKVGKWMVFFSDQDFAIDICEQAMSENICYRCKCTDLSVRNEQNGVICFYLEGDDIESHRKVIEFMIKNNLIRKTKAGKLYNISFKFDRQTRAKEYGDSFAAEIKMDQFIDVNTGDWIFKGF